MIKQKDIFNILYIGKPKSIKDQFGFNTSFVNSFVQKENAFLASEYLNNTIKLPNVILFDTSFINDNEINFYQNLRARKRYNKIVYILICNTISKKQTAKYFKIGIDEVILKPFDINDYRERITFLINYRSLGNIKKKKEKITIYKTPILKRIFDIVVSLLLILLTSPIILIAIIAIKIESKGDFYYAAQRVGTGYNIFDFYKLRSMHIDADKKLDALENNNQYNISSKKNEFEKECSDCKSNEDKCSPILIIDGEKICENHYKRLKKLKSNAVFKKIIDDPRVTKVGKFIRNTSIDELPQLINVLKGDMSIVGNRPLPKYEAEQLTSDIWSERFKAPSGITGLWQVEKRGSSNISEDERKKLDNLYARKSSFFSDLKLILKTCLVLVQRENV
jgi:lipopolysaccharide/colanic/teichoic acid biosynthesis glycosyltransferase